MNAKNLTIGGALVLLTVTLIGRFQGLVTDQALIWIALVAGMIAASYASAIGATEWFKRANFNQATIECINNPHSTGCDKEKRKTYNFAVRAGGFSMAACGVIFILLEGATWKQAIVIAVFWLFVSWIVGVTSPIVWKLFRNRFLRLAEEENEALDRPSEVPKE